MSTINALKAAWNEERDNIIFTIAIWAGAIIMLLTLLNLTNDEVWYDTMIKAIKIYWPVTLVVLIGGLWKPITTTVKMLCVVIDCSRQTIELLGPINKEKLDRDINKWIAGHPATFSIVAHAYMHSTMIPSPTVQMGVAASFASIIDCELDEIL